MRKLLSAALILALASMPVSADTERKRHAEKPNYDAYKDFLNLKLSLIPDGKLEMGKPVSVMAKLVDMRGGRAVTSEDLANVHAARFHLLLIDPTMTDYQHIHPQPGDLPGVYTFTFTPKKAGGYRGWADVKPLATGNQQFVVADLGRPIGGGIDKSQKYESVVDGYKFTLAFDNAPAVKGESMGTVSVATTAGQPVTTLEPVMGAYAHIVGFYDDFRTVVHTHPMGTEPTSDSQRGGPEMMFHLKPAKAGFVRLFAQVRIDGKDIYAPFGVTVAEEKKGMSFDFEAPDW